MQSLENGQFGGACTLKKSFMLKVMNDKSPKYMEDLFNIGQRSRSKMAELFRAPLVLIKVREF